MATVNYSVPDDIKEAFNQAFEGQNKSAVIARLMQEAVERQAKQRRSHAAIRRILDRRAQSPRIPERALEAARRAERP